MITSTIDERLQEKRKIACAEIIRKMAMLKKKNSKIYKLLQSQLYRLTHPPKGLETLRSPQTSPN